MMNELKKLVTVRGFAVANMEKLGEQYPEKFDTDGRMLPEFFETEIRGKTFIVVDPLRNTLTLTVQTGAIKENGVNGIQVDEVVSIARDIVFGLDQRFPSDFNKQAIADLDDCNLQFELRRQDRIARGVEGYETDDPTTLITPEPPIEPETETGISLGEEPIIPQDDLPIDGVAVYEKAPVRIQAIQFDGENVENVGRFMKQEPIVGVNELGKTILIITPEGRNEASVGDFIYRDEQGMYHPCKPEEFHENYVLIVQ
jgi:hypothetical protein